MTLTEVFDLGGAGLGRNAPLSVLRHSFRKLVVGRVCAVAADSGSRQVTRIQVTAAAAIAWRSGLVLRQVVGSNVYFEPMEDVASP